VLAVTVHCVACRIRPTAILDRTVGHPRAMVCDGVIHVRCVGSLAVAVLVAQGSQAVGAIEHGTQRHEERVMNCVLLVYMFLEWNKSSTYIQGAWTQWYSSNAGVDLLQFLQLLSQPE